ncbi:RHS repeat-associated core domain-containing protein [Tenacibaculum sp. 190524A02b]
MNFLLRFFAIILLLNTSEGIAQIALPQEEIEGVDEGSPIGPDDPSDPDNPATLNGCFTDISVNRDEIIEVQKEGREYVFTIHSFCGGTFIPVMITNLSTGCWRSQIIDINNPIPDPSTNGISFTSNTVKELVTVGHHQVREQYQTTIILTIEDNSSQPERTFQVFVPAGDLQDEATISRHFDTRYSFLIKQAGDPSYSFYYKDSDGDGFGDCEEEPVISNVAISGKVTNNLDKCPFEFSKANNGCMDVAEARNWTRARAYDITGRLIGSSKNYYNDLGKLEQSQSYNPKHNRVWASHTVYDSQERPTLQSMNIPLTDKNENSGFKFVEDLIQKEAGGTFTQQDLETTSPDNSPKIKETSRLGKYYYNNSEEVLQDNTQRPYTRSFYSELNPGTVKQKIGGNKSDTNKDGVVNDTDKWVQGYSFTMPTAQELHYVYGYKYFEVSKVNPWGPGSIKENYPRRVKISKQVHIDTKGNEVVTFVDDNKKQWAVAKSGGTKQYEVISLIDNDLRYVDIHLPVGCEGTLELLGNKDKSHFKVFNLKTEEEVMNIDNLPSGVYRFQYKYDNTVNNCHEFSCLSIDEATNAIKLTQGEDAVGVRYKVNYYDFSLNYYNEVGQLTSSLQPLGFVDTCLDGLQANVSHNDKLKSNFVYNALGQLVTSSSPDEGEASFKYRKDGQIRFSQNSKQVELGEFSYTNYDALARPTESGVAKGTFTTLNPDANTFATTLKKEQHFTEYDFLSSSAQTWLNSNAGVAYRNPTFLSGNVARTYNMEGSTILSRTYYSYDVYGRVKWMVQSIDGLSGVKTIDYEYDPITSQVNKVYFQKGNATEQFIHKYTYDEHTQQLVKVETSSDDSIFTTHADYTYYQTNGALKRTELAGGIQGVDYVYNLAGQLKAINHPSLTKELDPNGDETDLFGMTLDYYGGDYQRNSNFTFNNNLTGVEDQYTGNIKGMTWNTKRTTDANTTPVLYKYKYDRNNWLKEAIFDGMGNQQNNAPKDITFNEKLTTSRNAAATDFIVLKEGFEIKATSSVTFSAKIVEANSDGTYGADDYKVHNITYDANGNIESLHRNKNTEGGSNKMDELTYTYKEDKPNQLDFVKDDAGNVGVGDIGTQSAGNYVYNSIGQLEENIEEDVKYEYNASGLVTKVFYNNALKVQFYYNDKNFRTKKVSYLDGGGNKTTHYVLDASGSTLAIYENQQLEELPIYGASRLGIHKKQSGTNVYQLTDHLGNVRAVIAKNGSTAVAATSTTDYYPFGMPMPNRQIVNGEPYRYGYQGEFAETDSEIGKPMFQLRMWDARIGRWLSPDPYRQYPSPYLGMGNNPTNGVDPDGGCFTTDKEGNTIPCVADVMGMAVDSAGVVWEIDSNGEFHTNGYDDYNVNVYTVNQIIEGVGSFRQRRQAKLNEINTHMMKTGGIHEDNTLAELFMGSSLAKNFLRRTTRNSGVKLYRAMSEAEYQAFLKNGGGLTVKGKKELFVSTEKAYSAKYLDKDGYDVLLELNMKPEAVEHFYKHGVYHSRMAAARKGWDLRGHYLWKQEQGAWNLGIGRNAERFNSFIESFNKLN